MRYKGKGSLLVRCWSFILNGKPLKTEMVKKRLEKPMDQVSSSSSFCRTSRDPLETWRASEPAIYRNHIPPHLPFISSLTPPQYTFNALSSFHLHHLSYQVPTLSQSSCFSPLLWRVPLTHPSNRSSFFFYSFYRDITSNKRESNHVTMRYWILESHITTNVFENIYL